MEEDKRNEIALKFVEILASKQPRNGSITLLSNTLQNAFLYADIFIEMAGENRKEILEQYGKILNGY